MYSLLKDKNVLYVEDDIDVLKNISKLMKNYFKQFFTAKSAEIGLDIFQKESIDILLVDIELPGFSGIEFIKKIRQESYDIPIIIISAYTKTDYLLESIELKLEKYIVKPFTTKKLYEMLKNLNGYYQSKEVKELVQGVFINRSNSTITFLDDTHSLTQKEMKFLDILVTKGFINYDEISEIWEEHAPSDDAIRSFIKNIRKKLPHDCLKNRQNLGYFVENTIYVGD